MRAARIALVAGLLGALAALSACGTAPSATVAPSTAPTAVSVPTTPAAASAAPAVESSWTMPNLVGRNLQEAQDAIQSLTSFGIAITTSHDATGAGRNQVSDRNWKVCDQSVEPGATITPTTSIDFGAVKLDESC